MKFSEKILYVRGKLNMSQENLAKELNVAFITVNRWENGHSEPSVLPRFRFDEFCKKNGITFEE